MIMIIMSGIVGCAYEPNSEDEKMSLYNPSDSSTEVSDEECSSQNAAATDGTEQKIIIRDLFNDDEQKIADEYKDSGQCQDAYLDEDSHLILVVTEDQRKALIKESEDEINETVKKTDKGDLYYFTVNKDYTAVTLTASKEASIDDALSDLTMISWNAELYQMLSGKEDWALQTKIVNMANGKVLADAKVPFEPIDIKPEQWNDDSSAEASFSPGLLQGSTYINKMGGFQFSLPDRKWSYADSQKTAELSGLSSVPDTAQINSMLSDKENYVDMEAVYACTDPDNSILNCTVTVSYVNQTVTEENLEEWITKRGNKVKKTSDADGDGKTEIDSVEVSTIDFMGSTYPCDYIHSVLASEDVTDCEVFMLKDGYLYNIAVSYTQDMKDKADSVLDCFSPYEAEN